MCDVVHVDHTWDRFYFFLHFSEIYILMVRMWTISYMCFLIENELAIMTYLGTRHQKCWFYYYFYVCSKREELEHHKVSFELPWLSVVRFCETWLSFMIRHLFYIILKYEGENCLL